MLVKKTKMIPVTEPFLPPRVEYEDLLESIWERNWLTNNGPLVKELEEQLISYLDVPHLSIVSNGTIALQIAIKALRLKGEVLTTPFTYIATTSSLVWEGCKPVFVDIDPENLNMDPAGIADKITERTTAILATHVYGNPCDIEAINEIAEQNGLYVIYDAAHCFGTKYKGKSVYSYGDISTASFHATKLFHTVEGGALISKDQSLADKFNLMRNFGHKGPYEFSGVGINGKNSELHAAMGILNLRYIDEVLKKRKKLTNWYDRHLTGLSYLRRPEINDFAEYNYSYYAVIFETEELLKKVLGNFRSNSIQARRYFYPSLDTLSYVGMSESLENAKDLSKRILCLPLYHQLSKEKVTKICNVINKVS